MSKWDDGVYRYQWWEENFTNETKFSQTISLWGGLEMLPASVSKAVEDALVEEFKVLIKEFEEIYGKRSNA